MIHNKPPSFHLPPPHHHHNGPHGPGPGPGQATGPGHAGPVNVHVSVTPGHAHIDIDIDLHSPPSSQCCLPPPCREQSVPPAGEGLTKAEEFGANAIRTAGGYTIVPEGKDMAWSIYAPGQKPGEAPNSRIWGDPHVQEKDGTKWDFSKNSDFRLGDGTLITVGTTAQEGQSLSSTLDITNGMDHVQVSGIDKNQPKVGEVTHDGYQTRANDTDKDTFVLGGDKDHVQWFREKNGKMEGEVVGASLTTKDGVKLYDQSIKADSQYVIDPSLQPKVGTAAWGNKLRDEVVDMARERFGAGSAGAQVAGLGMAISHLVNKETPHHNEGPEDSRRYIMAPGHTDLRHHIEGFNHHLNGLDRLFRLLELSNLARPHHSTATEMMGYAPGLK